MNDEIKASSKKKGDCWGKDPKDCGSNIREEGGSLFGGITKRQMKFSLWYFLIALALLLLSNRLMEQFSPVEKIEFSAFKRKIADGEIKRVELAPSEYLGFPATRAELNKLGEVKKSDASDRSPTVYRTVPVPDESLVPLLDEKGVEYYGKIEQRSFWSELLFTWILPIGIMMLIWSLVFRRVGKMGAGVMSFGGNRAQLVAEGEIDVRFDDVAGVDEAKEELQEVVDFLKSPEKYTAVGGKIPKGVLLVGPPGTGKTLCARAVAGEAKVPFFKMSGADFVEMFVGVGAARVRDLFKQAKEKSPCIIFIDELDAIGKARGSMTVGGHDEREQTLNQLLVEMDGFDSRSGVIILAATNRPEILDPALLRPGRFDRQILVDRPDLKGREAILERHARTVKVKDGVRMHDIAALTPGFAGADLENLVNEAALLAVRRGLTEVGQKEFEDAIEKLVAGLEKKNRLLNKREREIVAHHEAGHALVAFITPGSDPVKKVSIVPRGLGALGYTMQTPTEDRFLLSEGELLGKIDVLLGGRAAEQVIFGEVSTGAANDLSRATETARRMITEYGMSEKFKNVALQPARAAAFLGPQPMMPQNREYSEETQRYIDETVAKIVNDRYESVLQRLEEKRPMLETVARELLEKETLDQNAFQALVA